MDSGELSSENGRSARCRGSSRREFLGRTIRGGALLATTTVLGNELRTAENQAESQANDLPRNPSSAASATTADLLVEKLVEWGVSVVFGLPGDKVALIMDALRRRQDKIRFVLVRHEEGAALVLRQRNHGGDGNCNILRVAAVTAETEVAARTD